MIADNFPNFIETMKKIKKAFHDFGIYYEHDPEEHIEEINE